ncbi:MAG: sugar phosphate isomerase/epimerase [Ruminococcaceae bacterium]|nr:sugar phosphate isomerase/epimerase [Oscillospiraceae bacterium]
MAQFIISAFADEVSPDLEAQIAAMERNGIGYLEPRNIDGGILTKTEEELYAIRARLDKAGIGISSLGSPIGKYNITDDFEPHMEDFKKAIKACKILGTHRMRIFSFFVNTNELATYRDEVHRRMEWMLDEAEKEGILLCHENESKIYGQNPDEVADLLATHPRLKGIFDAANFVRDGQDPVRGMDVTLPRLEYVHVKDASYPDRKIWPVGMGQGDYEGALKKVDAAYDGTVFLTLEPHLFPFDAYKNIDKHKLRVGVSYDSPDAAFDGAAGYLKNLLKKLGYHEEENKLWKK